MGRIVDLTQEGRFCTFEIEGGPPQCYPEDFDVYQTISEVKVELDSLCRPIHQNYTVIEADEVHLITGEFLFLLSLTHPDFIKNWGRQAYEFWLKRHPVTTDQ